MSKKVVHNIFNSMAATFISMLAPLIIVPLLTTSLGVELYGVYVALVAQVALFVVLSDLGFSMYIAKAVSVNRDNGYEVSLLFNVFITLKLLLFCVCVGCLSLINDDTGGVEQLVFLLAFFRFFDITPILSGLERYAFLTQINFVAKFLSVILVIFMDFSNNGLEKAIGIQIIASASLSILAVIYYLLCNKHAWFIPSLDKVKSVLKSSLPFYGARLVVNVYQQSSTYFVSLILSSDLVAIYDIGLQLYKVGQAIIGSIARVMFTSLARTKDFILLKKVTFKSLAVHIAGMPIVLLFGEEVLAWVFEFDVKLLSGISSLLFATLFLTIISSYWGYPALTAINKEKYAHIGILVASVTYFICFGVVLLFQLASIYLIVGCIFVSEFVGMALRVYFARKFKLL